MSNMENGAKTLTKESALKDLKEKVSLRDQMCGALYYNILNDECCQLADRCIQLGCNGDEVESILGEGTFTRTLWST